MHDPLNMSVHSRMGVWEKKVDKSEREKQEHVKSQEVSNNQCINVICIAWNVLDYRWKTLENNNYVTTFPQVLKSKSPLKSTGIRSTAEFKNALSKKAGEVQSRIEQKTGSNSSVSPMKSPGKVCCIEINFRCSKKDP